MEQQKDNWTLLHEEYFDKFEDYYRENRTGKLFKFFGLVNSYDDYYYGMVNIEDHTLQLLSCVGHLEMFGFTHLPDFIDLRCHSFDCDGDCEVVTYSDDYGPDAKFVEGLQEVKCKKCGNAWETRKQLEARIDKIHAAYNK